MIPYPCNVRCGVKWSSGVWHTRSCLLRRLLITRYDGVIPHGHSQQIAKDLGLSYARISAIVKELDMVVVCSNGKIFGYKEN